MKPEPQVQEKAGKWVHGQHSQVRWLHASASRICFHTGFYVAFGVHGVHGDGLCMHPVITAVDPGGSILHDPWINASVKVQINKSVRKKKILSSRDLMHQESR